MEELTKRERELVAIGAAMGSNCASCMEFHIPEARSAGLAEVQIQEAIELADAVRAVSARNVLTAASELLTAKSADTATSEPSNPCEKVSQHARRCC